MTVAEKIRERIAVSGMTLPELAKATGIAMQTLSAFQTGRRTPSFRNAVILAKALGCRVEAIAGDEWTK